MSLERTVRLHQDAELLTEDGSVKIRPLERSAHFQNTLYATWHSFLCFRIQRSKCWTTGQFICRIAPPVVVVLKLGSLQTAWCGDLRGLDKGIARSCIKVFSNTRNLFQRQRPTLKVTKEYRNVRFSLTCLSHLHQVSSLREGPDSLRQTP